MEQKAITEIKSTGEAGSSSTSHGPPIRELNPSREEIEDHVRCWKLFKAIRQNDWKAVEDFISQNPATLTARIKVFELETVFHVISRELSAPFWLIQKLVSGVPPSELEKLTDKDGESALFMASLYGNRKAAEAFVSRNYHLPEKRNLAGLLPVHTAAKYGHKETIQYLLEVTATPLNDDKGVKLLHDLITSGHYGMAFNLLKRYPDLVSEKVDRGRILEALANKPLAFASGSQMGYLRKLIYNWIPVPKEHIRYPGGITDVENQYERSKNYKRFTFFGSICRHISIAFAALGMKLHFMLWHAIITIVPRIKYIRDLKLMHKQTVEIVRLMCHEGVIWSTNEALMSLRVPILTAAKLGIYEIVREILNAYYYSYCFWDEKGHAIFHLAIIHRQDKVFSLLNKLELFLWEWKAATKGEKSDNILHLTAKLVITSSVPGAALQMQRELKWFKAVQSYVHPSLQEQRNENNKTPKEVFTEEHKELLKAGEKWMKETASSCIVAAALIITVVFAAAFTLPGGNNETSGMPNFYDKKAFKAFIIFDALALFSSSASLLMFMGIIASRYSEEDFLEYLPKNFVMGHIALLFSVVCMMVAFGETMFMILSHKWLPLYIPISFVGTLTMILFSRLQFPLLIEMFLSTYGPRTF